MTPVQVLPVGQSVFARQRSLFDGAQLVAHVALFLVVSRQHTSLLRQSARSSQ